MMTFRGGGGSLRKWYHIAMVYTFKNNFNIINYLFPEMVTIFRPIWQGGAGGHSLMTSGSGVTGLGGCWRIISGGAGDVAMFGSWLIIISPGAGGVGGRRYRIANSCTYSISWFVRLQSKSGFGSSFIGYSCIGKEPII